MEASNGFVICDDAAGQLPAGSVGKDFNLDKITEGGLGDSICCSQALII
jgi:hypothetical protein